MRPLIVFLLAATAVAVEVPAVVTRVSDGDTIAVRLSDGTDAKVRFLFVDTPESKGNAHGPAMPEGLQAAEFLRMRLPADTKVVLWGPKPDALEHDPYDRLLAIVWRHEAAIIGAGGTAAQPADLKINVNVEIVKAGWSPYWRKYGAAADRLDASLTSAQDEAREANAGAWATARQYMVDKGNETTAPRSGKKP